MDDELRRLERGAREGDASQRVALDQALSRLGGGGVSPKQRLYQELLLLVLPHIRNVQTHGAWRRARDRSCYFLAELVHNLPHSILEPGLVDHDFHFLNFQARSFHENASTCTLYGPVCRLLAAIFAAVPVEARERLQWSGPPGD